MHAKGADVNRIVADSHQERAGMRRDTGVDQEAHGSGAQWMQLVLGQSSRVSECLPDIL